MASGVMVFLHPRAILPRVTAARFFVLFIGRDCQRKRFRLQVDIDSKSGLVESKPMKVYCVYGLFDKDGCCLYVGQTLNSGQRFAAHRQSRLFPANVSMRILRHTASKSIALRMENQIMRSYQRNGEAQFCGKPGRPDEGRVAVKFYLLPATLKRIKARLQPDDPERNTMGKIVDKGIV